MKLKIVCLFMLGLILSGCSSKQVEKTDDIKILMEIRPEVNYVTHLYTLAGLGFSDDEYVAKYGNTLPQAAFDTLQKYKEHPCFFCTSSILKMEKTQKIKGVVLIFLYQE